MLKLGDILLIGPYTYKVVKVLGKWATFEFTNKEGIHEAVEDFIEIRFQAAYDKTTDKETLKILKELFAAITVRGI